MRISTKIVKGERRLYQVYANGKITPLLICFDRTYKEWDLCTDADHIRVGGFKRKSPFKALVMLARDQRALG